MSPSRDETAFFGPGEGNHLQFNFYVEKDDRSPITSDEANSLGYDLIGWIRNRGYGFDGFVYLGNVFKDGILVPLQKVTKKETQDANDPHTGKF